MGSQNAVPAGEGSPGRGRRSARWLLPAALLTLALIIASPFYLVRIKTLRERLLVLGAARLGWSNHLRLQVGEVHRFDPLHLSLEEITLEAHEATGAWVPVTRANGVELSWSARDLLAGRLGVGGLTVDSLEVNLHRLGLLGRGGRSAPARPAFVRPRFPDIGVRRLSLQGFALLDSAGALVRGDLDLRDLVLGGAEMSGVLERGELTAVRNALSATLEGGRFALEEGRTLALEELRVRGADSRVVIEARVDLEAPTNSARVELSVERIGAEALERLLPPAWGPAPGDSLSGSVEIWLARGRLFGDLSLSGILREERLESLSLLLQADRDSIRVTHLDLSAGVGQISGDIVWDRTRARASTALELHRCRPASSWLPWLEHVPHGERPFDGEARMLIDFAAGTAPALEGEVALFGASPWSITLPEILFRGRLETDRGLRIDEARARLQEGSLEARGLLPWDGRELDLSVMLEGADLACLPEAWRGDLVGMASGEVEVSGELDDPLLEGDLRIAEPGFRGWRALEVRGRDLLVRPRELRGEGRIEVDSLGTADARRDVRIELDLERWGEEISASGRLVHPELEADFALALDPRGSLSLERANFSARRAGMWALAQPFHLRWSDEALSTDSLLLRSDEARLAAGLDWIARSDRVLAGVTLEGFDLSRLNMWLGEGDSLRGKASLRLAMEGTRALPRLALDLRCLGVGWAAFEAGDGFLQASWEDSLLRVGPLVWHGPGHDIRVPEILLFAGRPRLPRAGGETGADFWSSFWSSPWIGAVEFERVDLAAYSQLLGLPEAVEVGSGAVSRIHVGGREVPVRVETPGEPEPEVTDGRLAGTLAGRLVLEGTPRHPVLRFTGGIPGLRFARTTLGDLQVDLSYVDSLVRVERIELSRGAHITWGRGFYPLHLALVPPGAHALPLPARLEAQLDELDLALVSGLTRWLPDAAGKVSGGITIEGLGTSPGLRGSLSVSEGGLRIPERSERIHDVTAMLTLVPEGLRIRSIDARSGPEGTITGTGIFRNPEDFDFSAVVQKVRVYEEARYDFLATADLSAYTALDPETATIRPHLAGNVQVWSGTITQDLAARELTAGPGRPIPWLVDLDVEASGNILVSQVNTKAELGEGQLHLAYRWPNWNASGSLTVIGGTYRLLNNVFTILDGTVEFRDTGAGPDLTIDVDAETNVTVVGSDDTAGENVVVTVHVSGKPEELEVTLSSVPPLSEEEIVELLSVGRFSRTGHFEAASETQWILMNTMVDRIESSLLEQSPLFSRVGIATGTSGEEPLRVTLRPIVTPAFLVNYSQDLALDPARELSMNYRLSRGFYLRAGIARDRESPGVFSEEYSLDLRYRIEYE
ncbi:MAG: translocation/assembly module TamB domain-containing protein [Candidatus Eisenbacteria bacterium]